MEEIIRERQAKTKLIQHTHFFLLIPKIAKAPEYSLIAMPARRV